MPRALLSAAAQPAVVKQRRRRLGCTPELLGIGGATTAALMSDVRRGIRYFARRPQSWVA